MKKFLIFGLSLLFISLSACKPTEKGYKAAYDAALGKRQAVMDDIDVNLSEGSFQQVEGAQLREVDGVKVYVLNQRIQPVDQELKLPGNYNVAVGTYKMITNCRAQSEALKAEGFDAFPAKEPDGMYYTIAGSFPSLSEAVSFYKNYQKKANRVYVGLPNAPVIIYSPN